MKGACIVPEPQDKMTSPVGGYIHPVAYAQRHIVSLKGVGKWSGAEIAEHFKHNRILQKGFLTRDPKEVVDDAILCKEDWLTDIVCPSVKAALTLHIAKNLVVRYKVSEEDFNQKTQEVLNDFLVNKFDVISKIESEIEGRLIKKEKDIAEAALKRFQEKYPGENKDMQDTEREKILEAFKRVQKDIEKRKITHTVIAEFESIDHYMAINQEKFKLAEKTFKPKKKNIDRVYLGAAGSGKSTIMRQQMRNKADKENMVILATDSYRGVTGPGSEFEAHERIETDQVFIRTQDTAYMIKELVQAELEKVEKSGKRPDILIDGVTLEGWHRKLLVGNQKTIAAVAALDDVSLVAGRAHRRALDPEAGPADKGRQVNTTALLKGHSEASKYWLMGTPKGVSTDVYDTNVSAGTTPKLIGRIHYNVIEGGKLINAIDVIDLSKIARFLGKANLNPKAADKADLYSDPQKVYKKFTYTDTYKAEEILKAVRSGPSNDKFPKPTFTINLLSANGDHYAVICEDNGELQLRVKNQKAYEKALQGEQGSILREITARIVNKEKTLEEAHDKTLVFGRTRLDKAVEKAIRVNDTPKPKL